MITDLLIVVRGMLMGAADVVPGVSGGTVALVVGIYDRLVGALSRFDTELLRLLRDRQWMRAAAHIDLRFLVALGIGILSGIVLCGGIVNHLLTTEATRTATLAAFFGMIAASCVVVIRLIHAKSDVEDAIAVGLGIAGIVVAYLLTSLPPSNAEPALWYVFFCGMVAICAMILPGISGAYILLILGVYVAVTDIIKRLPKLDVTVNDAAVVAVFVCGCAIGLLSFSKVLKWLLAQYEPQTMAVLAGFMIGALHKIWPFQKDLTPDEDDWKEKLFELTLPTALTGEVIVALVVAIIAFAAVLVLDRMFKVERKIESLADHAGREGEAPAEPKDRE